MSHAGTAITKEDADLIVAAQPFSVPATIRYLLFGLCGLGLIAFLLGIASTEEESVRLTWIGLQVNVIYWFCVAAAMTCFSAVFHICNAQWVRPIRRLFESANYFFLMSSALMILLYFGSGYMFEWANKSIEGRGSWLNPHLVYGRDILGMLILALLARTVVTQSLRGDIAVIRLANIEAGSAARDRWAKASYSRLLKQGGKDLQAILQRSRHIMSRVSPVVVIAYAVIMTLIAFDQVMSVDVHWYSTLFGAQIFMSAVYLAMAWVSIGVYFARTYHPLFRAKVTPSTLHDLGKLLFGFGIFWAYMFWSHYLTIWYGNLPEETGWLITRTREEPWHCFSWIVLGTSFIIPFFLGLSRDVKQIPILLAATGLIVAIGMWLQMYLLFVPTLYPDRIPLGWRDLFLTTGFLAFFVLSSLAFLQRVPLIPFGDLFFVGTKEVNP